MSDMEPFAMTRANTLFNLNNGVQIPALGLGTWQSAPGEVRKAASFAISTGYKHVDCAFAYGNEEEVGLGLKDNLDSGKIKREDLFITSKLWCTYHTRVEENLDLSLQELGLEYLDLYLMHWPIAMNPHGNHPKFPTLPDGSRDLMRERSHIDTYKDMEKLLATGKVKAIGVANYSVKYLEELLPAVSVVPAVNQLENHPFLPQQDIVDYCRDKGIHVTAYSPLGSSGSPLLTCPVVRKLAEGKRVSPATVLLSWHVSSGRSVLAKSTKPNRITENFDIVHLDQQDLDEIAAFIEELKEQKKFTRYVYPSFGVDFGFPDKAENNR